MYCIAMIKICTSKIVLVVKIFSYAPPFQKSLNVPSSIEFFPSEILFEKKASPGSILSPIIKSILSLEHIIIMAYYYY